MATFKPVIFKARQRMDKTWNVFIRFTHCRKTRYIATTMCVAKKDLTTSFKIKNQLILDRCDEIIKEYRKKCYSLNLDINDLPIDTIVNVLTAKHENGSLSFSQYYEVWRENAKIKGINNYDSAVKSFATFLGRDSILFSDITTASLTKFQNYLSNKRRAMSLYTTSIVKVFNDARMYYNDEDNGIIMIAHSLSRYKPPRQNVARKRALTLEQIHAIFSLPYNNKECKSELSRRDLALDCFKLSFCLMGINSADLFNATEIEDDMIVYERTKTKDRRNDHAEMKVRIHPFIRPLVEKYKGQNRVFNFYSRFSSLVNLNKAINRGLKEIGNELGIENLQFYSARHSFASIAANEVGIDRWTVNLMLNHSDASLKITELYIKRDFKPINDANFKVLEYVFNN